MRPVNPQIVRVPDGRVGCLVARHGFDGCVEFGAQWVLETYHLTTLVYHIALPPVERKGRRRTQMLWL
jgi:hypothetical protein